eukprot:754973-Hanusia_phi.AAC.3
MRESRLFEKFLAHSHRAKTAKTLKRLLRSYHVIAISSSSKKQDVIVEVNKSIVALINQRQSFEHLMSFCERSEYSY